jgi:mannose-1-phosphate guanylyltransferase
MLQAILLVGGQGTRLRPLTIATPKPMLPVAGFPTTEHQIARARQAGVSRIVLGTSFRAEVFEEYFGHGESVGVELVYAVEDEPLGTGGAIRNAAAHLTCGPNDPVIVFNGDVLTGLDIEALVQQWRDANADVALYLTRVEDPRAFGLVPTDADGRVLEFREKPKTEAEIVTDQINAGCYVFKRSLIDEIPADRPVSVERETFPGLLERGAHVIGVVDEGYWLDLGTPLAFAQGSADVVRGLAPSPLLHGSTGENFISETAQVDATATLINGSYVGSGVTIGANAVIDGSVIFDGATIAADAHVTRSIVGTDASIGAGSHVVETVIADRASVGAHNELLSGARVFPDSVIPDGTIRFSSDRS